MDSEDRSVFSVLLYRINSWQTVLTVSADRKGFSETKSTEIKSEFSSRLIRKSFLAFQHHIHNPLKRQKAFGLPADINSAF